MIYLGFGKDAIRRKLGAAVAGLTLVEYDNADGHPCVIRVKGKRVVGEKKDKFVFEGLGLIGKTVAVAQAPHLGLPMQFFSKGVTAAVELSTPLSKDVTDDQLYVDIFFLAPSV